MQRPRLLSGAIFAGVFAALFAVLVMRPTGLFGRAAVRKV